MKSKSLLLLTALLFQVSGAVTPKVASERWAAFSGGKGAKLVYGFDNKVFVLDLKAGTSKSIANFPTLKGGKYGISGCYRWSPSGKRILIENPDNLAVINEDGSNLKYIAKHHQCENLIWSDWRDDSTVVYSTGVNLTVAMSEVKTDNSPGKVTVLVSDKPRGKCYSSVSIDGKWLAFNDWAGNAFDFHGKKGFHRPLVKDISNLKNPPHTLIPDSSDMCQLAIVPDGKGTTIGQIWAHFFPATLHDPVGIVTGTVPRIGNPPFPQQAFAWSNQLEYFLQQGENTSEYWVWIRSWSKKSAGANIQVADGSDKMYYPDLWVGNSNSTITNDANSNQLRPSLMLKSELLNLSNLEVTSLSGAKISKSDHEELKFGIYQIKHTLPSGGVQSKVVFIRE